MTLDIPALRALAAAARERADKATAGPWRHAHHGQCEVEAPPNQLVADCGTIDRCHDDAAFIAAARTDVPVLAAALVAALDELERLRKVEAAALAWRGTARCPDHAETMHWCDSCVRSEDADEALADALSAGRGSK